MDERVLVIPASVIDRLGSFEGFCGDVDRYLPTLMSPDNQTFLPRSQCESDPSFKQLIPYLILESDRSELRIFRYTRGLGQTESRLHSRQSIGVGGHIAIEDCDGNDPYRTGMRRELEEEMIVPKIFSDEIVGLIYDASNDVGRVHLGVVHRIKVNELQVRPREADVTEAGFVSLELLAAGYERLETWSQLCVAAIYGIDPAAQRRATG